MDDPVSKAKQEALDALKRLRERMASPEEMATLFPGFPPRPTCHDTDWQAGRFQTPWGWEKRGDYHACSYCGSAHPASLLRMLDEGARLGGSDWKYGWPHKFYITHPNIPKASVGPIKWYNEHILDEGFAPETLAGLLEKLKARGGVEFRLEEGVLSYLAPYGGFQAL